MWRLRRIIVANGGQFAENRYCSRIREPSNENNLDILAVLFLEGGGVDLCASTAIIPQDDLFSRRAAFWRSKRRNRLSICLIGLLFEPRQTLFEFRRFERY